MGFHLISIDEDQLRAPAGDKDEFFRNIGTAVVLACLEPENQAVSIKHPGPETNEPHGDSIITVRYVAEHDHDDVELWVWASGGAVAIADLSSEQLETLRKIVASRQRTMRQAES
jgi:hypothetical protein